MCLVVHLTCDKGFYFIQEILFIGLRYGIFGTSEFHFTQIVCPVSFAFQQQVYLSTSSVRRVRGRVARGSFTLTLSQNRA